MPSENTQTSKDGKLLVLTPGLGAVATTFIAGVESMRQGLTKPIGSLTQMQTIRLGMRSEGRNPLIKDFVDLAPLSDIEFGGWDVFEDNAYEAAKRAEVLNNEDLEPVADRLKTIEPMSAVFSQDYVKRLDGPNVKEETNKMELAEALREDIRRRMKETNASRAVMIWCGSTEVYQHPTDCHQTIEVFEEGLKNNDESIAPSQIYAYAAIKEGVPYANGAPNLSADFPALEKLAVQNGVPIAGKDFKTGQTLMKTMLAPGFKTRMLGVEGWFSTNILGNRDGEILDDPESFKTKEVSKKGVLDTILQPDLYPDLYDDLYHKVRINYYPPRGDEKEGWDNIDIKGWMGYPMQIKVDFLCRDSILAAPIVLDLALFLDLAKRSDRKGIQEWLSFYFKSPQIVEGHIQEHDIFIQHFRLKNTLRVLGGEEPLTHLSENFDGKY
ncbi:inositol-3-phosphate synthase [Fodinibius saliphilus]|uniref:inositol-3-phosphate synthase n=1 Tax=Fodinibius saliphilus TaxID=1920650 RepID=UPI001108C7C5|nr:inositol-3-phosphate synthase [Fodinibius saliphilus]